MDYDVVSWLEKTRVIDFTVKVRGFCFFSTSF